MPEIARIDVVLGDEAPGDLPDVAVTGGRQLVEPVVAAEDQRGRAAGLEHADDERDAVERGDADRGRLGARRVAERSEVVEDGRDAELRRAPGRALAKPGVERAAKAKVMPASSQHLGDALGREGEVDAERGQHVRRPRRASSPPGCRA